MGVRGEQGFHHLRGGRSTVGRPPAQPLRGPCPLMTLGGGHVRRTRTVAPCESRADRARHAGPRVEEFPHPGPDTPLGLLLDECLGYRIVVAFDFDVIIKREFGIKLDLEKTRGSRMLG